MSVEISSLVIFVASAAGKAAGTQAMRKVGEMVGLQEAQLRLAKSIDVKVDQLVAGPFFAGSWALESAMMPHRDPQDRRIRLIEARTEFTRALGQDSDSLRRSMSNFNLATIWINLGSLEDVAPCLRAAHRESLRAMRTAQLKALKARRSKIALNEWYASSQLLPYCNSLAAAARAWGVPMGDVPVLVNTKDYGSDSIPANLDAMRARVLAEFHNYKSGVYFFYDDDPDSDRIGYMMLEADWNRFKEEARSLAPAVFEAALTELTAGALVDLDRDLPIVVERDMGQPTTETIAGKILKKFRGPGS